MASPFKAFQNFASGFLRPAPKTVNVASAAKTTSYPYIWANGSTLAGGYGVEYGWGTTGANDDIQWDKWGAAFAVVINEPLFRCVQKRSDTVGATPWQIIDNESDKVLADSTDFDTENALARAFFRFQARLTNEGAENIFTMWERSRSIAGETYVELIENEQKYPADLEWLNPLAIWINAPVGIVRWFQYTAHGRSVMFTPEEVVYHRLAMDMRTDVFGYSPVMCAIGSGNLNVLRNSSRVLEAFFRNDATPRNIGTPGGEFGVTGWDDTQITRIQNTLQALKGTANKYRTTLFPYPVNWQQLDLPDLEKWAKMLQDIEPRVYTVMGVPRSVAGDSDSTRYQASPDDVPNFNKTILSELDAIESVVNMRLVPFFERSSRPQWRFQFDRSAYETIDPALAQVYADIYRNTGMTLNQYRVKVGLDEIEGGDVFKLDTGAQFVTIEQITSGQYAIPASSATPAQIESGETLDVSTPPESITVTPPQKSAADELSKWRSFALKHGAVKAQRFAALQLSETVTTAVMVGLEVLGQDATKDHIGAFFDGVKAYYHDTTSGQNTPHESE